MWDIHHRRECDSEGRTLLTHKQLIERNLYYKRPAEELIFVTRSMHWKIHHEIRENCGKIAGKKRSKPILQFTKDGKFIKEWPSASEAERQLRIAQPNICKCCQGKSNTAGGFIWKYKNKTNP